MRKALLSLILILALTAAHTASAQVLINEVDTAGGTGQWIEFFNPTGAPIDVSGWQVQMYYDNLPGSNIGTIIIPGAAGSMTTVIPNEGFMVISDNVSTPALPVGVVRVTTTTFPTQWFAGIPYSIGLYDNVGNGVDYLAASNSNFFGAPLALGGTNTEWAGHPSAINPIGGGAPILGGQLAGAVDAVTYRHTRLDSDDASDWTNNGATGTGTPGAH
ncbi:MAG: lamin tail domain-containing protein, partial [Planctomycetes bacterium]|nr:lamin tail domain-containing protein [Planctomycetota bacterium]